MAGSYNKVILMGNLTRDPEIRDFPSGGSVAKIGLAVNRRYRNRNEEWVEETTFVDCEAFGRTADNVAKFFQKGRPIFIEGRLKLDQWEDKDGSKRSKLKVVVENFQFVDSKGDSGGGSGGGRSSGSDSYEGAHEPLDEADIPF